MHHNVKTLATYSLYDDITHSEPESHGDDCFNIPVGSLMVCVHFGAFIPNGKVANFKSLGHTVQNKQDITSSFFITS